MTAPTPRDDGPFQAKCVNCGHPFLVQFGTRHEPLDVERLRQVLNGMNLAPIGDSQGIAETIARRYARLEAER